MSNHFNNPRLNSDELRQLIPVFMSEIKEDFTKLEVALLAGEYEFCLEILHKIKGSALSFGITVLVDKTQDLRGFIHTGEYDCALNERSS